MYVEFVIYIYICIYQYKWVGAKLLYRFPKYFDSAAWNIFCFWIRRGIFNKIVYQLSLDHARKLTISLFQLTSYKKEENRADK